MHMDDQRLAGEFLGGDTGIIGEPVVRMDDIELILALQGDGAAHHGIAGHFLHEVGAVFAGELELLSVADGEVLHLPLFLFLDELAELLRIGVRNHIGADVDEFDLVQELVHRLRYGVHGHIRGIDDGGGALVFIAGGGRHHEQRFHAIVCQAFYDTLASRTEAACDVGRKLPAKH